MSQVEKDFDRLAVLDSDGWTANNHYHDYLLRFVPANCQNALELGCGTGALSRRLAEKAQQVLAIDLSPEMIRIARERSVHVPNLEFFRADFMSANLGTEQFDCVVTISTLHHLPLREALLNMNRILKPRGVLIVLDLFAPERNLLKPAGFRDTVLNLAASGVSVSLRLLHNGRLKPPKEVQAAWEEHGKTDIYPTMAEVRRLGEDLLPGALIRQHLLWRYSILWQKSTG